MNRTSIKMLRKPGWIGSGLLILVGIASSDALGQAKGVPAPDADFTGAPLFGCAPLTVSFTDQSIGATDWDWTFGDGATSDAQNPTHTYDAPGIFTVTLSVTDARLGSDTRTRANFVQAIGPDVDFVASPEMDDMVPFTVSFTDQTTVGAPITGWLWDFGDGNSSTQQNPVHTYTAQGNYDVSLTVTDQDRCQRTETRSELIQLTPVTLESFRID